MSLISMPLPDAAPFLPHMRLVDPPRAGEIQKAAGDLGEWFHQIDIGDLVTPGYQFGGNWSWVASRLQTQRASLLGKDVLELGPADGLWSCWLTKLGAKSIVAADVVNRPHFRLVIDAFGLPVEYHPGLISGMTPRTIRRRFDVVASLGVLYHVHDPLVALIMYERYLHRGGVLMLETGAVADPSPTLYYTGEGLIYGKEGGNFFVPTETLLRDCLEQSLGFVIESQHFREEYVHPVLNRPIGRSFIVARKVRKPTMHSYPIVVEQLGMLSEEWGPVEWAYGPWPSRPWQGEVPAN